MTIFPITRIPATIAGSRAFWIDPSDASTITASAGKVSNIADKFGSGNAFTQPTSANQPSTGGSINGLSALSYDGANTFLNIPATFANMTSGEFTIFTVSQLNTLPSVLKFVVGSDATPRVYITASAPSGVMSCSFGEGTALTLTSATVATSPCVTMIRYNGSTDVASLKVNNESIITGSKTSTATPTNMSLGAISRTANTSVWDGQIGEVIGYRTALTDSQVDVIMRYLGNKWGIAA